MTSGIITPIIVCGGSGTRLWPISRETQPKQFIPLKGGISTFQRVLQTVQDPQLFGRPIVITNAEFRFMVADQVQKCGAEADIALEPIGRDSGPAIAAAAELADRKKHGGHVLVLTADQIIRDIEKFRKACREALEAADAGYIVTFGVRPTVAATGYGYIKPGAALTDSRVCVIEAFIEKPDAETAIRYIDDGYLWNSGNFLFRADTMLGELQRFEPEMRAAVKASVDGLSRDLDFLRLPEEAFTRAPKKSFDYAVMERTQHAAVLPVDFGWSDIGTWGALWEELDRDPLGNAVDGPAMLMDTRNSLVWSDDSILTAVVGLDEIIVVTTPDAVLVIPKCQSEKVKPLVAALKQGNRRQAVEHRRIYRPWGYYQGVDVGPRYQVKRIVVKPGGKLSLQKHFHRSEHWVVVNGTADVEINGDKRIVHENESIYVPIGSTHRLANPGKIPLELIEVQVGSYLGEDDIVRFEDIYHRA